MNNVQEKGFKMNQDALRKMRQLPEVHKYLKKKADKMVDIASENGRIDGYKATDLVLEDPRAASSVLAYGHAYRHNRKYNTIVKALNQVRD